jgi:hypothetical protein
VECARDAADPGVVGISSTPMVFTSALLRAEMNPERQLFPGFAILALVGGAVMAAAWRARAEPNARKPLTFVLVSTAIAAIVVAALAPVLGPWHFDIGTLRIISVSSPTKPLTVALWCGILAALSGTRIAQTWAARSTFAFYVLAAAIMYGLSLGPEPTFFGQQFWYRPPYAWLLGFPVFANPLGDAYDDVAAMYRSIFHRRPVVNGYSGFEPIHYTILRDALNEGEVDVLGVTDRSRAVGDGARLLTVRRRPHENPEPAGPPLRIQSILVDGRPIDTSPIRDGNRFSPWHSAAAQRGTETVTVDLGSIQNVGCIVLSLGMYIHDYPRSLQIDVSPDGHAWTTTWNGRGARQAVAGALDDPGMVPLTFCFPLAACALDSLATARDPSTGIVVDR